MAGDLAGWPQALVASALTGFARPDLWGLALVGFLVRGGLLVFALPIVVLPTAIGIATFVGPLAITPAGPSPSFVRLVLTVALIALAWLVVAGVGGALVDTLLVAEAKRELEELGPPAGPDRAVRRVGLVGRLLVVRLAATIPVAIGFGWGIGRLIDVSYRELTAPGNLAVPLAVRVVAQAPDATLALLLGWLLGETLAALATRSAVAFGASVPRALAAAAVHLIRRPRTTIATALVTTLFSALVLAPSLVAAWVGWRWLRVLVVRGDRPELVLIASLLFVATWAGGLIVAGLASSWRSLLWSFEVLRAQAQPDLRETTATGSRSLTDPLAD